MNCIDHNDIMIAKEHCRVDDNLVEVLEVQRQVEPLSPFPTDETNVVVNNAREETEAVGKVEEPDDFMENVRAFIRGIDINTL